MPFKSRRSPCVRVHFAALPAERYAELGLGGGAAIGRAVGFSVNGSGGGAGGGPQHSRFIFSTMLCLTSSGAAVGRAARTLDHGHFNSSVPMGYM